MLVFKVACTLTRTGRVETGVHVFEVMLEDFPTRNITLTYVDGAMERRDLSSAPLCRVKLQFSVEGRRTCWDRKTGEKKLERTTSLCLVSVSQSFLRSSAVRLIAPCRCSCLRLLLTAAFFTPPWA